MPPKVGAAEETKAKAKYRTLTLAGLPADATDEQKREQQMRGGVVLYNPDGGVEFMTADGQHVRLDIDSNKETVTMEIGGDDEQSIVMSKDHVQQLSVLFATLLAHGTFHAPPPLS